MAFDSVVHSKLLHKLKCYGFKGLLMDWIKCFLTNRRQMIRVGSLLSHACNVISGVPQGSALGPILFIIYINDICEITGSVKDDVTFKLFADDVEAYACITNVESARMLQHCLDLICNWATRWQLKLSPSKCTVLSLGKSHVNTWYHCSVIVVLPRVNQMTDLGILIDDQLSSSPHIDNVCTKAKQRAALILNCFYSRKKYLLIRAFIAYVRLLLEYCCSVWSSSRLGLIDKLENIQRRITWLTPSFV